MWRTPISIVAFAHAHTLSVAHGEQEQVKVVLLSYLDRNKLVKVPEDKSESDVEYLKREFRKEFACENQVSIFVVLQRFDQEWGEYIDLDKDDIVENKMKLKVVIHPLLTTPATSTTASVTECEAYTYILYII